MNIIRRCNIVMESIRSNGLKSYMKDIIYFNRKAIIVVKDLHEASDNSDYMRQLNIDLVELTRATFPGKYQFVHKDRHLKALYYLSKGCEGYALVKGDTIIGDIWHFDPHGNDDQSLVLDWFGIPLPKGAVYSFDIFVLPSERGNNLSAKFLNSVMYALARKSYNEAYGYIFADNIPAVWNAMVINGFKEVKSLTARRFLWYRRGFGKIERDDVPEKIVGFKQVSQPHRK